MSALNVISLLGGIALFLFGISLMGDGLNKVAGNKLQVVLYQLTSNPLKGILLGVGVTALIQSSSATSIMAVGFVNSGLMEFAQAASIILGSIVGTSVTGWIISLSSLGQGGGWLELISAASITGIVAVIGILLYKFSKKTGHNKIGMILLGFAVLMYGMNIMSSAVSPLRESQAFIDLLTTFSNPAVGFLVGLVFTAVIQSTSAAVGILQALSMTGAISFTAAYPILLGIGVGGSLPVLLGSVGASLNARRTALVYLVVDILGALICGVAVYAVNALHPLALMDMVMNPVRLAAINTIYRVVTAVVLAPTIGLMEKLMCLLLKEGREDKPAGDWDLLEERFVQHPALALEQCRIVITSMADKVRENVRKGFSLIENYSEEGFEEVRALEELVDQYEDKLGTYLVKVSVSEMTKKQNEDLYAFLHAITDLERISDHANNIAENAQEIHVKDISLPDEFIHEMHVMHAALEEVLDTAIRAITKGDQDAAHHVEPLEELIDNLCDEMKHRHIDRLQRGVYSLQNSFVFNDLITNYERISDHCSNIAVAIIELEHESFDTHNYIESLMSHKDQEFVQYFQEFKKKYSF